MAKDRQFSTRVSFRCLLAGNNPSDALTNLGFALHSLNYIEKIEDIQAHVIREYQSPVTPTDKPNPGPADSVEAEAAEPQF